MGDGTVSWFYAGRQRWERIGVILALKRYVLWLWLLSGAPIGIALIWMPPTARLVCFTLFILLDMAHTLSPIMLAWSHAGFRRVMLGNPRKYIGLPSAIFAIGTAVSVATAIGWTSYVPGPGHYYHATGWDNPFPIMVGIYFAWNFYHFGMQNYGIFRLVQAVPGRHLRYWWSDRFSDRTRHRYELALAFFITAVGIKLMPLAVSVNHWVTDIGLSWRASRCSWVFASSLLVLAPVAFLWGIPIAEGIALRPLAGVVIALYGIRLFGVGFIHFLYSRWVWKLSDPQVRVTIGKELFA